MAKTQKNIWTEVGIAAAGAAIGSIIGMLATPKNGKQNREAVAKEAKKVVKSVKKKAVSATKKVAAKKKK